MNYNPYAMSYYKKPVFKADPLSDPYSKEGAGSAAGLSKGSPSRPELTGRRRFRRAEGVWGKKPKPLILQVEESVWNDVQEGREGRWVNEWRDATPEDVTEEVV